MEGGQDEERTEELLGAELALLRAVAGVTLAATYPTKGWNPKLNGNSVRVKLHTEDVSKR